jgi:hypothetical protein
VANTVAIAGNTSGLTVQGFSTVGIGNAGSVAGINGGINATSDGTVTVDDSKDPNQQTVSVSGSTVTGFPGGNSPWLSYSGLQQLVVNGGTPSVNGMPTGAGNTFDVTGTAVVPQGTTINTGGGSAAVNVGDPSNTLNGILGALTVAGQGKAALTVNDVGGLPASATKGFAYTVTNNSVSRTGTGAITYSGTSAVTLYAANTPSNGAFNDIAVESTAAGTTYQLYAGTGYNIFGVSDGSYTLNGIQGPLFLHAAGGTLPNDDVVELYDVDKTTAHSFTLTAGATSQSALVQRFNLATKQPDMAPISFDGIDAYAVLYTPGSAGDTINLQSEATNVYWIIAAGTGDTVNIGNRQHTMAGILGDVGVEGATGQKPTVVLDDSRDSSARSITMGGTGSNGYQIDGLLPASSVGYSHVWLTLDPSAPVTLKTGNGPIATNDVFTVNDLVGVPALKIDAGNGVNTLVGPNLPETWNITGANSGSLGAIKFSNIQSLVGGTASDVFKFGPSGSLAGSINGGGGGDWLDYSGQPATTPVTVNLVTGAATGVAGGVSNIQNVRGGPGNDTLTGNGGNILIGGSGKNTLTDAYTGSAAADRSLLIGGSGGSNITAGAGGDIMIGGTTTHDNNNAALMAILAEWHSGDSYLTRFDRIEGLQTGGLNGKYKLVWGKTVLANSTADTLTGSTTGLDWFFANLAQDTINNLNQPSKEHVNNTP